MQLRCPNGCDGQRFEALNAPLIVDAAGRYVEHRSRAATYVCAQCQAVAVDIAAAAREMHRRESPAQQALVCPACGLEMLPPEDDPFAAVVECPGCETRFGVEEGTRYLLGGPALDDAGGDDDL